MFDELSYLGYTALFTIPPLILLWLRQEFCRILLKRFRIVALSTLILTGYGSAAWPVALKMEAWSYASDRITGTRLLGVVVLEDVVWWFLISLLFASFVVVSTDYEDQHVDVVQRELLGLLSSFRHAFGGLHTIALERNATVHLAVASFVVLEAVLFRITPIEWLFVTVVVASVVGLELLNSSIERVASRVSSEPDDEIRRIKDTAAAGVLVAATGAAIIGVVILLSRLIAALR